MLDHLLMKFFKITNTRDKKNPDNVIKKHINDRGTPYLEIGLDGESTIV